MFDDLKDVLSRALEQLTPRQREVFNMSRDLQMSHKEIAEALGVSVNTVQEHISVSLKVIRAYLSKYSGTSADILLILLCLNIINVNHTLAVSCLCVFLIRRGEISTLI